ncbi:unnamed protein product [Prorocentrum cordatum]|uniref:Uncharacterized protein n=1 Tax=Prorocentrum cordatum TaxID=2364126 RepID=A0ABN9TGA4_9DINO|nr:unnamed protein product [Polarella glacialis]
MPGSAAQISDEAAEAELRELRGAAAATSAEAERRHARELEQLRAELRESRAREAALAEEQGRQSERSDACSGQLRELEAELEESLLLAAGARGGGAAAEAEAEEELRQLQAAAEELAGKLRAARSWAEARCCAERTQTPSGHEQNHDGSCVPMFGLWEPLPGFGAVKKRLSRMKNRSQGIGRDLQGC